MTTYALLRQRGIQHLTRMTGQRWTDFNAHDPGITLLEALCYTLTDLGYRAAHDVPDLLADGGGDPYDSLHAPAKILTTYAVTAADLRRLVLDVEGVKNAWIEPVVERLPGKDAPLLGLYRITVEASGEGDGLTARREVGKRVHRNRGLCEDCVEIVVLEPLDVCVDATIEIGRVDDPAITYAAILDAIAEVISPTIPFTSLAERLAAGLRIDEAFDGPLLDHGIITDEALSLARHRAALHSSDILRAIMDVPGVRAVTTVVMRAGDAQAPWSLDIPPDRSPRLDRPRSRIALRSAGMPVAIGAAAPAAPRPPRVEVGPDAGVTPPPYRDRHVAVYHSVQHHLPEIYGVGELGLPDSAPPERKAKAKQLKAYLMLFDQIMANHLAQLAHMRDLFSFSPAAEGLERTYFTQPVDEPTLGLDAISRVTRPALEAMMESPDACLARKHRWLNHLLARFAEDLNDRYAAAEDQNEGEDEPQNATGRLVQKLVGDKQAFLRNYPRISGSRGTAADGFGPWGLANPSGLEDRIRFKLALIEEDGESMAVIEHIHLRPGQANPFGWFLDKLPPGEHDPYSLKLTFVFPGQRGRFGKAGGAPGAYPFREVVERTLRAQTPAHLITYVLWLDDADWKAFYDAHVKWRRRRREALATNFGVSLGLDTRLRATLPGVPLLPGYTAVTGAEPRIVDYNTAVQVEIDGSEQLTTHYSLVKGAATEEIGALQPISAGFVEGNGDAILVTSMPATEDMELRVKVERVFEDTVLLDATLPLKVRANAAAGVTVAGGPLVDRAAATTVTISASQTSVAYSVHARPLTDLDLFVAADQPALVVQVPSVDKVYVASDARVTPPPAAAPWKTAGYARRAGPTPGTGGDLTLSIGPIAADCLVVVQAHKDHGAVPADATDVQLTQALVLLGRPGPAPSLALTASSGKVQVTGGEEGVRYYLLDPQTLAPLGRPAYFHRHDAVSSAQNRGIGRLAVGRDFALSRCAAAPGADLSTTPQPAPQVDIGPLPSNRTVMVMAVNARTGASWAAAKQLVIG